MAGKSRARKQGEGKSARQVRFLLSKGSPLSGGQKDKLKGELRSGAVKVKKRGR